MRLAFLSVTALLATVAIQTPAFAADPAPHRHESSTLSTASESKSHFVGCGHNEVLLGMGARVNTPSGNGVVLTSVVPDTDAHTVTATAHARLNFGGSWSLTVFAICDGQGSLNPQSISQDSYAECPDGTILYGTGFELARKDGTAWADQVVPNVNLSGLSVAGNGTTVSAWGICAEPLEDHRRITVPNSKVAPKPPLIGEYKSWVFGAGAIVPEGSYLTTLGFNEDLDRARIDYGTPILPMRIADEEDQTVYGTLIGWWYLVGG